LGAVVARGNGGAAKVGGLKPALGLIGGGPMLVNDRFPLFFVDNRDLSPDREYEELDCGIGSCCECWCG